MFSEDWEKMFGPPTSSEKDSIKRDTKRIKKSPSYLLMISLKCASGLFTGTDEKSRILS